MPGTPKAIDHLVLPVADLVSARMRLSALGFTVAADAHHPFGTENACVFFADGTYLEPLAVTSRDACKAAVKAGNMFIARDQAFRFRCGDDGFTAVVFKCADAPADHAAYTTEGLSGGPMLSFSRPVRGDDGTFREASFHLAFAADLRAPDFFFFSCERVNATAFPNAPEHANGVTRLVSVVLSEDNPADFRDFAETALSQPDAKTTADGLDFAAANAHLSILRPAALLAEFGTGITRTGRGLRGEGIVLATTSLAQVEQCLAASGVHFIRRESRLIVPPAVGQGAFVAFEEEKED